MNYKNISLLTTLFSGALLATSCGDVDNKLSDGQKSHPEKPGMEMKRETEHPTLFLIQNKDEIVNKFKEIIKVLPATHTYGLKTGYPKTGKPHAFRNTPELNDLYRTNTSLRALNKVLESKKNNVINLGLSKNFKDFNRCKQTKEGGKIVQHLKDIFEKGFQGDRMKSLNGISVSVNKLIRIREENKENKKAEQAKKALDKKVANKAKKAKKAKK